jgi:K+ transporter
LIRTSATIRHRACGDQSLYAHQFLLTHGVIGLVTLGAVFLAVTGGEALYADLGHFGRKPIQTGVALLRAAVRCCSIISGRARW